MIHTDFLVIGSGMAGLIFALKVSDYGKVVVITKKEDTESNTNYAQGGIASVFAPEDSFDTHIADTVTAGAGLSNRAAVEIMVEEGPRLIQELRELGVEFSEVKTPSGKTFDLGMEGGHSQRRIVHAKDFTGREVEKTLVARVRSKENVRVVDNCLSFELITDENRCFGAWVLRKGTLEGIFSKFTLIAAGGCGRVYYHTTNPKIATGDGIAMAYSKGAEIRNMEFIQFHPTSLYGREIDGRKLLISEAVRGEGGVLRAKSGEAFMEKYDPRGSLAARDVVARAIDSELKCRGDEFVWLDLSAIGAKRIVERFPQIYSACLSLGIDITKQPIPVVPAAHYACGGIAVDLNGRTSIEGLYAAGEASCVGVHGANRLASNSLLEALVFSERAAQNVLERIGEKVKLPRTKPPSLREEMVGRETVERLALQLRKTMWEYVGIVRSDERLAAALKEITELRESIRQLHSAHRITVRSAELNNLAAVALLIAKCAIERRESRGLHYNIDHPERDDVHYRKDTVVRDLREAS